MSPPLPTTVAFANTFIQRNSWTSIMDALTNEDDDTAAVPPGAAGAGGPTAWRLVLTCARKHAHSWVVFMLRNQNLM